MKYIAVLLLILIVACQKAEVVPDPPDVQPEPDLMQETCEDGIKNQGEVETDCGGPCKPCDVEYAVRAEEGIELRDKIKPSDKAKFLTNSYPSGLSVGDSHTFAMAVNNIYTEDNEFWVENEFIKAEDSRTNSIPADETTMMGWLSKNDFEHFTLMQYEVQIMPVGITVGEEMAPGVPTEPGNYYFRATVKRQKTRLNVDDYVQLDYSIKVK